MSEPTTCFWSSSIIERLKHMENGHKENGMRYEAEVCYRAVGYIEELRSRCAVSAQDYKQALNKIAELQAQVDAIKPIADYANRQADMAQIRLLKQGDLYDDTYWQPVLDKIRFELLQIAAIKGDDDE